MNANDHERARKNLADAMLGILEPGEQAWLEVHLRECPACAEEAGAMRLAVSALRSTPVQADPALVQATRRSVRLYAERLRETESQKHMFLVSSALAAVVGAASLPYLLRLFAWAGGFVSLPQGAAYIAVLVFWLVPGLIAALVLLASRAPWPASASRDDHESRRTA